MDTNTFDGVSRSLASATSRRSLLKMVGGGIVGGIALTSGLKGTTAQAGGVLSFPVAFTGALGSFAGTFDVTRFAVQRGQVVAIGTLTGTVTDALGAVVGSVTQALTLPVAPSTTGTCEILDLVLGPLDLTILGLRIQLNQIMLRITAQRGSLLGDLLCAIAGLLSGQGGALGRLSNLLNQLLGALSA